MKANLSLSFEADSCDPKFSKLLSALSDVFQNQLGSCRPAKEKLHLVEPKTSHPGHGRGGHSTEERIALFRGALDDFSRENPEVGGLEGRAAEFPEVLAKYGYRNSGPGWWGKDFRRLQTEDTDFSCIHNKERSQDIYRIVWAAGKETVRLKNTGRFTLRVGSGGGCNA